MRTNASEQSNVNLLVAQVLPGGAEMTRNVDGDAQSRVFESQVAALLRRSTASSEANEPRVEPMTTEKRKGRRRDGEESDNGLGLQLGSLLADKSKVDLAERNAQELRTRGERSEASQPEAKQPGESKGRERVREGGREAAAERGEVREANQAGAAARGENTPQAARTRAAEQAGMQANVKIADTQRTQHAGGQSVKQVSAAGAVETRSAVVGAQHTARAGEQTQASPATVQGVSSGGKGGRADAFKQLLQAAQPTRRAVEQQQVAQSAVKAMGMALKEGGGEVTMKLAPEALGQVKVKLVVQDAGVDAMFTASTASARQLLEASTDTLRDALEARGLRVDSIVVDGPRTEAQAGPQSSRDVAQDARREANQQGQGGALTSATDGRTSDEPGRGSQRHERGEVAQDARHAEAEVAVASDAVWDIAPATHVTAMGVEWVA